MTFILTQRLLPTAVKCNTIYVLFLNLAQYRGKHLWLLLSLSSMPRSFNFYFSSYQ